MPYATAADLSVRFGDDELTALTSDQAKIDMAIEDADALINSYLAVNYAVPVTDAPQLKAVSCDLARYNLYDNQAPEQIEKRQKERISWLKDISTGKATLGIKESTTQKATGSVVTLRSRESRKMTSESLKGFW